MNFLSISLNLIHLTISGVLHSLGTILFSSYVQYSTERAGDIELNAHYFELNLPRMSLPMTISPWRSFYRHKSDNCNCIALAKCTCSRSFESFQLEKILLLLKCQKITFIFFINRTFQLFKITCKAQQFLLNVQILTFYTIC